MYIYLYLCLYLHLCLGSYRRMMACTRAPVLYHDKKEIKNTFCLDPKLQMMSSLFPKSKTYVDHDGFLYVGGAETPTRQSKTGS